MTIEVGDGDEIEDEAVITLGLILQVFHGEPWKALMRSEIAMRDIMVRRLSTAKGDKLDECVDIIRRINYLQELESKYDSAYKKSKGGKDNG